MKEMKTKTTTMRVSTDEFSRRRDYSIKRYVLGITIALLAIFLTRKVLFSICVLLYGWATGSNPRTGGFILNSETQLELDGGNGLIRLPPGTVLYDGDVFDWGKNHCTPEEYPGGTFKILVRVPHPERLNAVCFPEKQQNKNRW